MRATLARLTLVAKRAANAWTQISPPLPHRVGDWRHVVGRRIAMLVGHTVPAKFLESLHAKVRRGAFSVGRLNGAAVWRREPISLRGWPGRIAQREGRLGTWW